MIGCRGATCYLNAVIQSLYFCPEFRVGVMTLPASELHLASLEAEEAEAAASAATAAAAAAAAASAGVVVPAVVARPPSPDPEAVAELVDGMGFTASAVRHALRKFPMDRESVLNYLLDGNVSDDGADADAPAPAESAPEPVAPAPVDPAADAHSVVAPAAPARRPKPRRIPLELQRLFARLHGLDA